MLGTGNRGARKGGRGAASPGGHPNQQHLFPPAFELGDAPPKLSDPTLAHHRRKIVWFAVLTLCWAAAVFMRLAYLQVVTRGFYEEKARGQHERTLAVRASRGLILDRRGRELAVSVPVDSICAMPAEISDPGAMADILSHILGLPRRELVTKLSARHGFCWIARLVEPEVADRVRALGLKGIYFQKESKRYYPKGAAAAHLIGAVGLDQVGLAGIEQAREEELQGRPGVMVVSNDARQRQFAGQLTQQPDPGINIALTIDERIQYVAERELNEAIGRTSAKAGSIVVLDPNTGDLLAIANYPSFNPNQAVRSAAEMERRRNFAISSAFEPGSTFKLITIAGALEEKVTRPDEVLDCQMGSIVIAGHRIRDHKAYGLLTVQQVLANSSDVCTIKLGMRLGEHRMYQYIRRFGFGRPTGVELPGEAMGLTRPAEQWSKISIGAISMGQEVGITAVQLVQAVGAIANGGTVLQPHIIDSTFETGGKRVPVARPPGRRVISPETAIEMKRMMEMVVLNGTGKAARMEGYTCGGKTGTAQKIDPRTRTYSKTDYVASFVGMAPLNNPAVVIAIILDSPRGLHSGGGVSAPVFPRVAGEVLRYLNVPQELPVDPSSRRKRWQPDPKLLAEVDDFNPDNGLPSDPGYVLEPAPQRRVTPVAYSPPSRPPATRAAADRFPGAPAGAPQRPAVLLAMRQGSVPDFFGKPLREVVEQATAIGLTLELRGSGVARRQSPAAGSPLTSGARVTVEFDR
jgi:cell division protein FtsI (penicillin-binding protein 3)